MYQLCKGHRGTHDGFGGLNILRVVLWREESVRHYICSSDSRFRSGIKSSSIHRRVLGDEELRSLGFRALRVLGLRTFRF